jgi:hypothetical protein
MTGVSEAERTKSHKAEVKVSRGVVEDVPPE